MYFIRIVVIAAAAIVSAVSLSGAAQAFCGKIEASASGYSQQDALTRSNNKGLAEVRKIEGAYGRSNVHYNPAQSSCRQSGGGFSCYISQKFCADGGRPTGRGEEGHGAHGCPAGTKAVPETDNCVPVRKRSGEFEHEPWKKPGCKTWKSSCDRGDSRGCANYESNCQVN